MGLDILKERGAPLERQHLGWRDLVGAPIGELCGDASTRLRIVLMRGIEREARCFSHAFARMCTDATIRRELAEVRRQEQHQEVLIGWLLAADPSPLATTVAHARMSVELTARVALAEPDPRVAEVLRSALLDHVDHLHRLTALLDRLPSEAPGAALDAREGRAPIDDLRQPYDRQRASPMTKIHALTVLAAEQQTQEHCLSLGPTLADPAARRLCAEIAHVGDQRVTRIESLIDPRESFLEKWLLHEATEVHGYWTCAQTEDDPRFKPLWERLLEQELGHLHHVIDVMERIEGRDPRALLPAELPDPIRCHDRRELVRLALEERE